MADYSDILPGPYINYDIFLELLTHIPRQTDMMALMSTCKILWADGIKPLLAFGVIIRTPSALRSFCTFMLSDIPVRAPLLRRLYLAIPLDPELEMEDEDDEDDLDPCLGRAFASLSKDLVKMFARVMEKTTNIEDLSIDSAEEIFDRDEEECLAAAVVALRHIRRMHIGSIRDTAQEILGQVKSPLLELDLDCSDARAVDFLPRITGMAQYYTRTLQKLTTLRGELYLTEADLVDYADLVDHADDDNDGNHGTNNDGDDKTDAYDETDGYDETAGAGDDDGSDDSDEKWVTFDQLRALALRNLEYLEDGVTTLYTMFPVIRHLEISIKEDNLDAEHFRAHAETFAFDNPWGALDRMCGSVNALYALGGFPVAKVLEVYRIYSDVTLLRRLRTVVSCALPNYLVLHIGVPGVYVYHPLGDPWFFGSDLAVCLPFEGSNITHLAVNLDGRLIAGTMREHHNSLICLLNSHPIQFLIIRVLHRKVFDEELALNYSGLKAEEKDENYVAEEWIERIRLVFTASRLFPPLFENSPRLTHVVLEVQDYAYEHVVRGDGGRLMQFDEATSRGILKTLGLGLSDGRI